MVRSWVELTDNPDSYMLLMDNGPDGLPDPATEIRVPLHRGARFVVDTQRLWHVVVHTGDAPRYALITSFESSPALDGWIQRELPRSGTDLSEVQTFHAYDAATIARSSGATESEVGERGLPTVDRGHGDLLIAGRAATAIRGRCILRSSRPGADGPLFVRDFRVSFCS